MISRVLYLFFGFALVAWSSLPLWRVPTLVGWKCTIVAGEFGHWMSLLALLALAAGGATLLVYPGGGAGRIVVGIGMFFSVIAGVMFWWPSMAALRIARDLPERLGSALGGVTLRSGIEPFDMRQLFMAQAITQGATRSYVFAHAGTADALALDFYPAATLQDHPRGAPCVIVIHGGGWDGGDRKQLPELNFRLASLGYAVAAITYRLAPAHPWPAQREDVIAAMRWIQHQAPDLGVDPQNLVILGRSAGGQLASSVGYSLNDRAIRGVVSFYGPHDLNFAWRYAKPGDALNSVKLMLQYMGGTPQEVGSSYDAASGIDFVRDAEHTPPTLLVHGKVDTLVWVKQSRRLAAKLEEAKVPFVYIELPWGTHAFDVSLHGPGGQLATFALEYFLASVTSPSGVPRH